MFLKYQRCRSIFLRFFGVQPHILVHLYGLFLEHIRYPIIIYTCMYGYCIRAQRNAMNMHLSMRLSGRYALLQITFPSHTHRGYLPTVQGYMFHF